MTFAAIVVIATLACDPVPQLSPPEIVQIDGKRNPEMIPQWSAWEDALRVIGGQSAGVLPDMIALHVTTKEGALILRESKQQLGRDEACKRRLLAATDPKSTDPPELREQKRKAITLECRWDTLRARDRIFDGTSPDARLALLMFVDHVKAGTRITLLKRDLPFFLQPQ